MAGQPEPGWRRLHAEVTSRKYRHRGRCMRLPPMVAMLRSCAEALSSSAWEITGNWPRTSGCAARSVIRTSAPTRSPVGPSWISRYGRALMSTTDAGRSTVSRIRSTKVVPPAMYRPPAAPADSAARSSMALVKLNGNMGRASGPRRGLRDRGDNVRVCAAPADVPAHPLPDLARRAGVFLRDASHPGHDLTGGAVAALERVVVDECLLQRVQSVPVREALDGGDLRALAHHRQGQAGVDPPAAEQHGAGTTRTLVAALLGAGQLGPLAQQVQQ